VGALVTAAAIVAVLSGFPGERGPGQARADATQLEVFAEVESVRGTAWPEVNAAAALVQERLPAREGDADRLLVVKALAAEAGVAVVAATFDPPRTADEDLVGRADVRITVAGAADRVRALLGALESNVRVVLLEGFTLSRAPEGAGLIADLRLGFPMRDPAVDLARFTAPLEER
jgi:hypothetical protein